MHPTDEGMIVLEGHVTFQVGGQEIKAGPRTFASIPRLTQHSFIIDEPGTRLLNFYIPGGVRDTHHESRDTGARAESPQAWQAWQDA